MDEVVAGGIEDVGAQSLHHQGMMSGLERFHYRRVFREVEVVKGSVSQNTEQRAGEMLKRKAAIEKMTRLDAAQQDAVTGSQIKWSTARGWGSKVIKWIELAVEAAALERAALVGQETNVAEKSTKSGCSVAPYIKRVFGL